MSNFFSVLFSAYVVAVTLAIYINSKNKLKGLKGITWVDCLNPVKFLSVLYGFLLKTLIPLHVFEQYVLRIYNKDCNVCIKGGSCIGGTRCGSDCACGCDTLAKMYSPLEEDSAGNWVKIEWNKDKYEAKRKLYPIKIEIKADDN